MHRLVHVAVLVAVLGGAGSLALLLLWPLTADTPLGARTRLALAAVAVTGAAALLLEWRFVH